MKCDDLPIEELLALDHQPKDELYSKVSTCLCRQTYGQGTADIGGIGVVIGFGFQLSIATIYWIFFFFEKIAIPTVRRDYTPSRFTEWLSEHQQNCLWSQLLYTMTICFAGLILQAQRGHNYIGVYESYSIQSSVIFTFISLELTVITNFNKIERTRLFYSAFSCTLVCGIVAAIYPMWGGKREHILKACERYANTNDLYWKDAVIKPFKDPDAPSATMQNYIQSIASISFIFFLLGLWLYFWLSTGRWPWLRRLRARPLLGKLMDWACVLAFTFMSVWLLVLAYQNFPQFLKIRGGMDLIWDGEIEQNVWGIGQVGALFSWAPLVVGMICSVVNRNPDVGGEEIELERVF